MQTNNRTNRPSLHDILSAYDNDDEQTLPNTTTYMPGADTFALGQASEAWNNTARQNWTVTRPTERPLPTRESLPALPESFELAPQSLSSTQVASDSHKPTDRVTQPSEGGASLASAQNADVGSLNENTTPFLPAPIVRDLERHVSNSAPVNGARPGIWARRSKLEKSLIGVVAGIIVVGVAGGGAGAALAGKGKGVSSPSTTANAVPTVTTSNGATATYASTTKLTPMTNTAWPTLAAGTYSLDCAATAGTDKPCAGLVSYSTRFTDTWIIASSVTPAYPAQTQPAKQQLSNPSGFSWPVELDSGSYDFVLAANYHDVEFDSMGASPLQPAYNNGTGTSVFTRTAFYKNGSIECSIDVTPPGQRFDVAAYDNHCSYDVVTPDCVAMKIG